MDDALIDYLERPVNLQGLLKKLDFSEENIFEAASEQAKLFKEASRLYVQKYSNLMRAQSAFDLQEAEVAIVLRERKLSNGKKALTEGAIKERVTSNLRVRKRRRRLDAAHVDEVTTKLIVEAFRQRNSMIKIVVDARIAEGMSGFKLAKEEMNNSHMSKLATRVRQRVNESYRKKEGREDDE